MLMFGMTPALANSIMGGTKTLFQVSGTHAKASHTAYTHIAYHPWTLQAVRFAKM